MKRSHCKRGHPLTGDNVESSTSKVDGYTRRRCVTCRRAAQRAYKRSPAVVEARRIYQEAKRRERGIAPRPFTTRETPQAPGERLKLPVEPFANYLAQRVEEVQEQGRWLRSVGLDERSFQDLLHGSRVLVHIDTVDKVLTNSLETQALELLYPVEEINA